MKIRLYDKFLFALPLGLGYVILIGAGILLWQMLDIENYFETEKANELRASAELQTEIVNRIVLHGDQEMSEIANHFAQQQRDGIFLSLVTTDGKLLAGNAKIAAEQYEYLNPNKLNIAPLTPELHYSNQFSAWMLYYDLPLACIINGQKQNCLVQISTLQPNMNQIMDRAFWALLAVLILGTLLVALFTWHIVGWVRKPMNQLAASAQRIADGDFNHRVFVPDWGVVRGVAVAVAAMADRLQRQLNMFSTGIKFQREFVYNLSSELQLPINSLLNTAEKLNQSGDAQNHAECRDAILKQAQRLNSLLQDISCIADLDIKQSDLTYRMDKTDLAKVADRVVASMSELVSAVGMDIKITKRDSVEVNGDPGLLDRAVAALVDNAIRFSKGKHIEVTVLNQNGKAKLSVIDDGVGIAKTHVTKVFDRFYRIHSEQSAEFGGTGLGLALVKHIALLHHGNVILRTALGQGCDFCLTLPLAEDATADK